MKNEKTNQKGANLEETLILKKPIRETRKGSEQEPNAR